LRLVEGEGLSLPSLPSLLPLFHLLPLLLLPASTNGHDGGDGEEVEHFKVFHVEWKRVEVPYIVFIWILATTFVKLGFQKAPAVKNYFPESSILIVMGLILGIIFFLADETKNVVTLTPDIFFLFLLPPIIGEAGYFMPNRLFFDQLGTILLMAVVGTIFNMFTIGIALWGVGQTGLFKTDTDTSELGLLETFLFGSLIAAVDPVAVLAVFDEIKVDEVLNITVFGESLLNDGVAVVLYHMFEAFCETGIDNVNGADIGLGLVSFLVVAGGGTLIGIITGYIAAFTTRFMDTARVLEPLVVLAFAYLSYLTAEIFHMSGILSITFCGITMKNYVEQNISENSSVTIRSAAHMIANCAEMMIFMFLGVYTVNNIHEWNWWFVIFTIGFCLLFRVVGVLLLVSIANRFRITKLGWLEQFIMMYGGLRGGVAFALVLLITEEVAPHAKMFVTTTLAMVYFTVFVQGITIGPLVKALKVKTKKGGEPSITARVTERLMDQAKTGMVDILGDNSEVPIKMRNWYKSLDDSILKPLLLREDVRDKDKVLETFEELMTKDAMQMVKSKSSVKLDSMVGQTNLAFTSESVGKAPGGN